MARIWEELLQQQLRAQHVHVERTRNRAVQHGRKWMGASRLERAEPHGGSPGQENYFIARWTLRWGPTWDWKGEHVRGGSTRTGATRQERAEPHGQFTGIDDFMAHATSTVGPRGRHQGRQHGRQHAKIILVLAWRN